MAAHKTIHQFSHLQRQLIDSSKWIARGGRIFLITHHITMATQGERTEVRSHTNKSRWRGREIEGRTIRWAASFCWNDVSLQLTIIFTHTLISNQTKHRITLFSLCRYILSLHHFTCYIKGFAGNNYSVGGLFLAGRGLGRYYSMLHDLITKSHVSYHSTLWWDLRNSCLALFCWGGFFFSTPSFTIPPD